MTKSTNQRTAEACVALVMLEDAAYKCATEKEWKAANIHNVDELKYLALKGAKSHTEETQINTWVEQINAASPYIRPLYWH